LRRLLEGQPLGVLATSSRARNHATLVAYVVTDDLREVLFATSRATRKFEMLQENPHVALLVDDRSNQVADFRDAAAVTIHGRATEIEADRTDSLREIYLGKHPYLADFIVAPSCALLSIEVESYDLVVNFQEVHVLRIGDGLAASD
jgi:uncharacterized protein YhbP (UPF0306 family)